MAESTGIEWTDHTFNPWWGCEKVSPACARCYAETLSNRRAPGQQLWGEGHAFRFMSESTWKLPERWNRQSEHDVATGTGLGRRHRVFCASMADVFEERDELEEPRRRLVDLIGDTTHLDWQILTKRPEFARDWWARWCRDQEGRESPRGAITIPTNVWMGVSIENARYTWRADVLRQIPAAVRFLSCEPLLGSLYTSRGAAAKRREPAVETASSETEPSETAAADLDVGLGDSTQGVLRSPATRVAAGPSDQVRVAAPLDLTGIDWVIVGGESGRGARPMHPDWAREIRDACLDAECCDAGAPDCCGEPDRVGPAFFFKQWGEWAPESRHADYRYVQEHRAQAIRDLGTEQMARIGKKAAGRELDGRTWSEFPTPTAVSA